MYAAFLSYRRWRPKTVGHRHATATPAPQRVHRPATTAHAPQRATPTPDPRPATTARAHRRATLTAGRNARAVPATPTRATRGGQPKATTMPHLPHHRAITVPVRGTTAPATTMRLPRSNRVVPPNPIIPHDQTPRRDPAIRRGHIPRHVPLHPPVLTARGPDPSTWHPRRGHTVR